MSSNEQAPLRRRKLSLNKKTPTRLKGSLRSDVNKDLICTPTSAHIPIPKKSLRNLKNDTDKIDESDESSAEIGWDNNSPSPSTCAKPSKRNCNGRNNDIAAILKNVPRKKKSDTKDEECKQGLKTWMQDDLAVVTYSAGKSMRKNNKTLRTQTQRKKARSNKELISKLLSLQSMCKAEPEAPDSDVIGSTPQRRSPQNGAHVTNEHLLNVSPINSLLNEKSSHEPMYESPIAALPKISESTPLHKCPVAAQSLVAEDNLDNINWSYVDTPAVKRAYANSSSHKNNNKVKNVACKALYENNDDTNGNVISNKPMLCKNLLTSDNVTMDTAQTKGACKTIPDDNSLMNIDFDDDMDGCGSVLYAEVADGVPVAGETTSCKALFTEKTANVEKIAGKSTSSKPTCNGEILIESNSLMNIDFDDDLDEILSTQPLDTLRKDAEAAGCLKITENKNLPVIDDNDLSLMEDKDVSLLLEDPLVEEKDECMVSQNSSILDEAETSMLLDDNFSDVLDDLNSKYNKDKKEDNIGNLCNRSPNRDTGNTAFANNNKQTTLHTPSRKTNIDLIGFDDADDFDDILVSLDGSVKCKSQETPPQSITSDQRKLKSRCHTSPFPLSSKRTLLKHDSKNFEDSSVSTTKQFTRNELSNDTKEKEFKEIALKLPPDKPIGEVKNKSSLLKTKVHSVQPFEGFSSKNNPNKNGYAFKSTAKTSSSNKSSSICKPPLNISVIGKNGNKVEEEDSSICISKPGMKSDHFTSTQKCSLDEIQRKREEAQLKLKQRCRLKK